MFAVPELHKFCVSVRDAYVWEAGAPFWCLDLTAGGVVALITHSLTHKVREQEVLELCDARSGRRLVRVCACVCH